MTISDGVYGVHFVNGAIDFGSGTITLRNGVINGGDHGFFYQGSLEPQTSSGDEISVAGKLHVRRWNERIPSVVPGLTDYMLEVKGSINPVTHSIELQGTSTSVPGTALKIKATKLGDLVE
ncbi:GrlR family regulatory protein [Chromobacterium haemolyticum]|uniref:GrlR family regulatory protein n=1 Tax=Chromobacterium haemolyticum TaxID=394935 RepID=UPI0015E7DBAA|nr:GrlR family regulatory protein [Chromobacterium haemolyticum]UGA38213.1 hypothetical protein JOS77_30830 [Chromobacterium haemolyticum]